MVWCSDKPCRFLAVFNQLHIKIFDFGLSPEVIDKEDVSKTLHLFLSKSFFFLGSQLVFHTGTGNDMFVITSAICFCR